MKKEKQTSQSDKFKAMAKELEATDDVKAFDSMIKTVAPVKKKLDSKG